VTVDIVDHRGVSGPAMGEGEDLAAEPGKLACDIDERKSINHHALADGQGLGAQSARSPESPP